MTKKWTVFVLRATLEDGSKGWLKDGIGNVLEFDTEADGVAMRDRMSERFPAVRYELSDPAQIDRPPAVPVDSILR